MPNTTIAPARKLVNALCIVNLSSTIKSILDTIRNRRD